MEVTTSSESILERLKQGTEAKSDSELARLLGVSQQSISSARTNSKVPDSWVRIAAQRFGLSADWLLFGVGTKKISDNASNNDWQPAIAYQAPQIDDPYKSTRWQSVPLIGLANCGDEGWFTAEPLAIRVDLPIDYPYTVDMFAVLAVGTSMQPEGIRQGYVAFCNPSAPIEAGDVVYIERTDKTAAIKKYLKTDNGKVHVQGWHPPDHDGAQKPYYDELDTAGIKRMACVVIVRRKA